MADKAKRQKRAFHDWLDGAGNITNKIEEAVGLRYQNAEPVAGKAGDYVRVGDAFDYVVPGAIAGTVPTMLALFGADTLTTNTASAARQARDANNGDGDDDITAIRERFGEFADGRWADPNKGPRGPRYDRDTLAEALMAALKDDGKKAGKKADYLARFESEDGYIQKVISNDTVKAHYFRLRGGKTPAKVSTDDLA